MEKLLVLVLLCNSFWCQNAQDPSRTPQYPTSCGGSLRATGVEQRFASPGYPIRYPPNQYCAWTITADPGMVVLLAFDQMELESNCDYDNITVYDEAPPRPPSPPVGPPASPPAGPPATRRRKRQAGDVDTPTTQATPTAAPTAAPTTTTPAPTTTTPAPTTTTPAPTTTTPAPTTTTPVPTTTTPAPTAAPTTTTTPAPTTTTTLAPTAAPTTTTTAAPTPPPRTTTTPAPTTTTTPAPTPAPTAAPTAAPTTTTTTQQTTTRRQTTRLPTTTPTPTQPPPPPPITRLCGVEDRNVISNDNTMTVVMQVDQNRQFRGFLATFIQIADSCTSDPCKNGGMCVNDISEGYVCQCSPVYGGKNCEVENLEVRLTTTTQNRFVNTQVVVNASQPKILAFDLKACSRQEFKLNYNTSTSNTTVWKFYMYPRQAPDDLSMMSIGIYSMGSISPISNVFVPMDTICSEWRSFWISWSANYLRIGSGLEPGADGTLLISARSQNTVMVDNLNVQLSADVLRGVLVSPILSEWVIYRQPNFTVPTTCGGQLTASSEEKIFASPGWPGGYPPSLNCQWVITAPVGERISMKFVSNRGLSSLIELPDRDNSCKLDSVIIYDGTAATGAIINEFCGNMTLDTILSTSNVLTVVFLSNERYEYAGFVIMYASDSEGDQCAASNPCQNNGTCIDTFRDYRCQCVGYVGKNCTDLPPCASSPCQNGGTCTNGVLGDTYSCRCASGFFGQDCSGIASCGGQLSAERGIKQLASPYYPSTYRSSLRCTWNIVANPEDVILISFESFRTEGCCDCLDVHDGSNTNSRQIQHICGSMPQQSKIRSSTNVMTLYFTSDGSINYQGFVANYSIEFNQCESSPCKNNATCRQELGTYSCMCDDGWMGTDCDVVDGDDCAENPCQNNSTCVDMVGDYECLCPREFIGTNCTDPNPCASDPCANDAPCVITLPTEFATTPGSMPMTTGGPWTGGGRFTTIPPWIFRRTTNVPFGTTIMRNTDLGGYFCDCQNRYSGDQCESIMLLLFKNNNN